MGSRFGRVALCAMACCFAMIGCGDSSKKPGCKTDKDCKNAQHCSANKCVECSADSQCPSGQKCSANACIAAAECTSDNQCTGGKVCQAGKCKPCAADSECSSGTCSSGACQPAKKCAKDDECADDEDCVGGFCKKGGGRTGTPADVTCSLSTVYFGFDSSGIEASERDRLDKNQQCLEKNKTRTVLLIGHTDTQGTEEYNIALSERRAQSVADYLSRLGTDPARMQVVPKGETEPSGLGDDKDRRCDFQWK